LSRYHAAPLALVLLTAACVGTGPARITHETCTGVAPYVGEALRAPASAGSLRLRPGDASGITPSERASLAQAHARAREATGAPTMTVAAWQDGGAPWTAGHGTAPGDLHYWASVGKIVTAAAILRLEEQGRLSLEDPVAAYVDGVPNGDIITLRMLLSHTSGLFSANEAPDIRGAGARLDLAEVLTVVREEPPYACPGAAWRYSNTGYTLLGAVIERVTGQPYHEAAETLVLSRSAASNLRVLAPDEPLDGIVAAPDAEKQPPLDIRGHGAAGGVVADAESMALLLRDLLSGRIIGPESVARMAETLYQMFDNGLFYGLGLMVFDLPGPEGSTVWIGHSGGVPGRRALVAFAPDRNAIIAVALTGEGSAEATVNTHLGALEP
jgi:D-alanyl-D-alanine carboxypeptidase